MPIQYTFVNIIFFAKRFVSQCLQPSQKNASRALRGGEFTNQLYHLFNSEF